jgi:hypothetical protein
MTRLLAGAALGLAIGLVSFRSYSDEPPPVTLVLKQAEAMVLVQALPKVRCGDDVQGAIICGQVIQILLDIQKQVREQPRGEK